MSKKKSVHPGITYFPPRILYYVGKYFTKPFYKLVAEPPKKVVSEGPVLLLCKHWSNMDIPLGYPVICDIFQKQPWCVMKHQLAHPAFMNFFFKIGGIPINRVRPEKTKNYFAYAKKVFRQGNILVIFPEATRVPAKMGKGRIGGFEFLTAELSSPITVYCIGMEYTKNKTVNMKYGEPKTFTPETNTKEFFQECMLEIAKLSNLEYKFTLEELKV